MSSPDLEPEDFALEQDDDGNYPCPVDTCGRTCNSPIGVSRHYGQMDQPDHANSIAVELVGEDAWREFLEIHSARGRSARDLAADLPEHIGRSAIARDKERFDIRTEKVPYTGTAASLLARPDVTTIEKARDEAKKLRARTGGSL